MKIKFKENKLLSKENFKETLLKAIKKIDEYEMSEFLFEKEFQKAYIKFMEEVVDSIIQGIALKINVDPKNIKKSYKFKNLTLLKASNGMINEDSLLLKSLWEKLKEKYTKAINIFKKFFFNKGEPLEPMKIKGNVNYNSETMNILKDKQWNNIENGIVDYLKDTVKNPEEEFTIRAGMFGLLRKKMDDEGISIDDQKKMSYDDLVEKFGTKINDTGKIKKELIKEKQLKESIEYAKNHAAEYLSIKDGELKNKLVKMMRKQIVGGLEDGISKEEMISRLYWIDPEDELGKRFNDDTVAAWNRDLRRICVTEFSYASNNGYLAANKDDAKEGEKVYFVFNGQYNPQEKSNRPCNLYLGKIGVLVDQPQSTEDTNDILADYAIWYGKNNVGRKEKEWWFCVPVHCNCTHHWERINPETQKYNEEIGKIEYKTIEKSTEISIDNIDWKQIKAKPIEEQLPELIKKVKTELKINFPIIVRLYKEHEEGKEVRSLHDEGIIIIYENSPDPILDFYHELGHLYYHISEVEKNKSLTSLLNNIKNKIEQENKK